MVVEGCKVSINMSFYESVRNWIREILDHQKTQKICAEAVHMKLYSLEFVPARFKNQVMYTKSVSVHSFSLELEPYILAYVPDQYKTKEICNEAMRIRLD